MYCKKCGQEMADDVTRCPQCGEIQYAAPPQPPVQAPEDKGGFLWGLLGCCLPIVGLILFLVWKDNKPKTAKSAIIGAAIGFGLGLLSTILTYAVGIGAALAGM